MIPIDAEHREAIRDPHLRPALDKIAEARGSSDLEAVIATAEHHHAAGRITRAALEAIALACWKRARTIGE